MQGAGATRTFREYLNLMPKPTSLSILVLALLATITTSGCIGLTGSSKAALNSPSAPAGHFVTLTWTSSHSDVAAYNVYRSQSAIGPFKRLATIVAVKTQFIDKTVEVGKTYYYVITSVGPTGMESSDSTMAYATVPQKSDE